MSKHDPNAAQAAQAKAGSHDQLADYPDDPRPAIDVLVGQLSGQPTDRKGALHAAWHIVGYGLGQFDPHSPDGPHATQAPAHGGDKKQRLKAALEDCKSKLDAEKGGKAQAGGKAGATAISWKFIVQMLLEVVNEWLSGGGDGPAPAYGDQKAK